MDRNYFLSYGQIAFLLLLSTIGKLNARIISAIECKSELLHYTDIKDTDHPLYLSYTFPQDNESSVVCGPNHHTENSGDSQDNVFGHSSQCNLPMINDHNFFLLSMKNLHSVFPLNKWEVLSPVSNVVRVNVVKQVKRFYLSSVKLIDGFKFIIKIPDKLTTAFIE